MSAKSQKSPGRYSLSEIAKAKDSAENIFIEYKGARALLQELNLRLEEGCILKERPKTTSPARITVIGAPSGFGKTRLVEYFMQSERVLKAENDGFNLLYVVLPPDCSIKTMTTAFLHEMKDPLANRVSTANRNSQRIVEGLKEMKCALIVIDEMQHLLGERCNNIDQATDWLKVLLDRAGIPVIAIGKPEITIGIKTNNQLERRTTKHIHPSGFQFTDEKKVDEFMLFVRSFERQLPLKERSGLYAEETAGLIFKASGGLVGRVAQLVIQAMEISMLRRSGPDAITREDLRKAYAGQNPGEKNPFDGKPISEPTFEKKVESEAPQKPTAPTDDEATVASAASPKKAAVKASEKVKKSGVVRKAAA